MKENIDITDIKDQDHQILDDALEVDVIVEEEEIIEEDEQGAHFEELPELEEAVFDEELKTISELYEAQGQTFTKTLEQRLDTLTNASKSELDLASYMQVMYLQGKKFEAQDNKNAARYCAMRMLWMKECQMNKRKKRPRYLYFNEFNIPTEMDDFIITYTEFLTNTYDYINRKLFTLTVVLFFVVFALLYFLVGLTFVFAGLEALLLGMLNYILQKRRMPAIFQKNQTEAIAKYISPEVAEFDRPIRFS